MKKLIALLLALVLCLGLFSACAKTGTAGNDVPAESVKTEEPAKTEEPVKTEEPAETEEPEETTEPEEADNTEESEPVEEPEPEEEDWEPPEEVARRSVDGEEQVGRCHHEQRHACAAQAFRNRDPQHVQSAGDEGDIRRLAAQIERFAGMDRHDHEAGDDPKIVEKNNSFLLHVLFPVVRSREPIVGMYYIRTFHAYKLVAAHREW